jgi:hypothetical protein
MAPITIPIPAIIIAFLVIVAFRFDTIFETNAHFFGYLLFNGTEYQLVKNKFFILF